MRKYIFFLFTVFSLSLSIQAQAFSYSWDEYGLCFEYSRSSIVPIRQVAHLYCREQGGSHFGYAENNICHEYSFFPGKYTSQPLEGRKNLNKQLCERNCVVYPVHLGGDGKKITCDK